MPIGECYTAPGVSQQHGCDGDDVQFSPSFGRNGPRSVIGITMQKVSGRWLGSGRAIVR